jgi:hypothetical protein
VDRPGDPVSEDPRDRELQREQRELDDGQGTAGLRAVDVPALRPVEVQHPGAPAIAPQPPHVHVAFADAEPVPLQRFVQELLVRVLADQRIGDDVRGGHR